MTRWWDPGSDVALLEPFGVANVDLANAFVALHRAGAAAIHDAIDTYPVIDDQILVGSLALAREAFAPMLIEPVAKATGSPVSYAGLLLRDVYDDAEAAAVQLFTVGVTKGLPRRVAAERVAKVFGVGQRHLGRYGALAVDPRTPTPMIADLADETLFAAIAEIVAQEATGIAKAESPAQRRAAQADEPRERGRYAVKTVVDQLMAQVNAANAEAEQEQETTAAPAAPQRRTVGRAKRAKRANRVVRDAAGQPLLARQKAHTPTLSRQKIARRTLAMRRIASGFNRPFELVSPAGRPRDTPDDYTTMVAGPPITQRIEDTVAFTLPTSEANSFFADAPAAGDHAKVFRAHALTEYAGDPRRYNALDDTGVSAHDRLVRQVASNLAASDDFTHASDPFVYRLSEEEIDELTRLDGQAGTADELSDYLDELAEQTLLAWQQETQDDLVSVHNEIGYVDVYQDYNDDHNWVMVYTPPPARGSKRPIPTITELVLHGKGDDVRGTHELGTRYGEEKFTLDPNLPLRVVSGAEREKWDDRSGTLITIRVLQVGDEHDMDEVAGRRFGKAESREQRRAAQADQPRDHGRYTTDAIMAGIYAQLEAAQQAQPTPVRRPGRAKRANRVNRRGAVAQPALAPQLLSSRKLARQQITPRVLERNRIATDEAVRGAGEFQRWEEYAVVGDKTMARKFGANIDRPVTIEGGKVGWLSRQRTGDGEETHRNVLAEANSVLVDNQILYGGKSAGHVHIETDADWRELEHRLVELLMDDNHDGVYLTFYRHSRGGRSVVDAKIETPRHPLPAQHVLRWESGTAASDRLELVPEAEIPAISRRFIADWVERQQLFEQDHFEQLGPALTQGASHGWIANPRVIGWRVQDPD